MRVVPAVAATLVLVVGAALAACAKAPDANDESEADAGSVQEGGGGHPDATSDVATGHDSAPVSDAPTDTNVADSKPQCVPTDAGCTTTSPGACAAGIIACDDAGAPFCRPLVTSQPCYSGAPATRGKGACKDGAQTCIGALGACTGEVVPTAHENCFNTVDDDCDGAMNNACPDHLVLGTPTPLGVRGGAGGSARTAFCPPNSFVSRSTFYFDHDQGHASGVAIYCAAPTLVQGASAYSVTLTQVAPAPYVIATGGDTSYPDGDYDCGITGLVAGTWFIGESDNFVEGLGMHCGAGAVNFAADNTLTFTFTEFGDATYTRYPYPGSTTFRDDCPPQQVLIGYNLRSGNWLDQIQAVCAPLITVYK